MNRVNGCLAVSRALGDYEFKKRTDLSAESQQVSGEPECTGAHHCFVFPTGPVTLETFHVCGSRCVDNADIF